jgi:hypothetical protein
MTATIDRAPRILAVASSGGHWVQLLRLRPAFEGSRITYVSVDKNLAKDVVPAPFVSVPDANRSQKIRMLWLLVKLAWVVFRVRPDVVVSTGAAPGYFAIRIGRALGARTLFIDSLANAEKLSLSAHLAEKHSDLLLTQWPHLAKNDGPKFFGSVI